MGSCVAPTDLQTCPYPFSLPGVPVELIGDNGLPFFIHVNVFVGLVSRPLQLRKGLQHCASIGLSLEPQPYVAFADTEIFAPARRR